MNIPRAKRFPLLAEGLELLVEHIREMHAAAATLRESGMARQAAILQALASEESAKVLLVLDVARLGWNNDGAASKHLALWSNHVTRGIYVETANYSPGTFRELRGIVERLRPSHYLDGPTDVDWVFRNEIEARREETIYVDLLNTEDGLSWVTPQRSPFVGHYPWEGSVKLVLAMNACGVLTARGLEITSEVWNGVEVEDLTPWPDMHQLNVQVLRRVWDDVGPTDATRDDVDLVLEHWTYPLTGLDLKVDDVNVDALPEIRERETARLLRDYTD